MINAGIDAHKKGQIAGLARVHHALSTERLSSITSGAKRSLDSGSSYRSDTYRLI